MAVRIDPEENEVRALQHVADWQGQRVIEIGCGDGRLTLRLARLGARVHAVDPDAKLIRAARQQLPQRFAPRVHYRIGKAEHLEHPNEAFDLAVFAWVL